MSLPHKNSLKSKATQLATALLANPEFIRWFDSGYPTASDRHAALVATTVSLSLRIWAGISCEVERDPASVVNGDLEKRY
jgi:hypothetical protein